MLVNDLHKKVDDIKDMLLQITDQRSRPTKEAKVNNALDAQDLLRDFGLPLQHLDQVSVAPAFLNAVLFVTYIIAYFVK